MSGSTSLGLFQFLFEIELYTFLNCQPYEQSWMSALLSTLRLAPILITIFMFGAGYFRGELYLLLFAVGLFGDFLINLVLNLIFPGDPRVPTCMPVIGSAIAYQVQHTMFFVTFVIGFFLLYRTCARIWQTLLLFLFASSVVLSAHFLNYFTSTAIVAGALVGTANALIYQSLLYWFVVPQFAWLVRNDIVRYLCYYDTLCTSHYS